MALSFVSSDDVALSEGRDESLYTGARASADWSAPSVGSGRDRVTNCLMKDITED